MKKQLSLAVAASLIVLVSGCNKEAAEPATKELELDTMEKKISYIFGYNVARQTMQSDFELDADVLAQAIKETQAGAEPRFTEEEIQAHIKAWRAEERERAQAKRLKEQEENQAKGETFLAENAQKEGVTTTESGLQYKVLQQGEGASPSATDRVKVHYRGTLLDGTEFDSSFKRNEPVEFVVGNLIPGWVEALQLMKEGDKYEIYVPSALGYGPGGTHKIPPNSVLIFEMELLEVLKKEETEESSEG